MFRSDSATRPVRTSTRVRAGVLVVFTSVVLFGVLCAVLTPRTALALSRFDAVVYEAGSAADVVDVAVGDVDGDGLRDILGVDAANGGICALLAVSGGEYASAVFSSTGSTPAAIATGDFDGDGCLDVATIETVGDRVTVILGDGHGEFGPPEDLPTGSGPVAVAVADVDGDAAPDIVTADQTGDSVSVLLNEGAGEFAAAVRYGVDGRPCSVTAGDLDGDGYADLVTADPADNTLGVLLGRGDGTFSAAAYCTAFILNISPHPIPADVSLADIDRDGHLDALVAEDDGYFASVSYGDGAGSFSPPASWHNWVGSGIVAADLDGDGVQDMLGIDGGIHVRYGTDDGRFTGVESFGVGTGAVSAWAHAAAVADMDEDGAPDVVTANGPSGTVTVLSNDGPSVFRRKADAGFIGGDSAMGCFTLAVADMDEDGRPDIVAGDGPYVSVALGTGNGLFTTGDPISPAGPATPYYRVGGDFSSTYSVKTGDFDGDGHEDVVAGFREGIMFLPGDGEGRLGTPVQSGSGPETGSLRLAVADVDEDGRADVLATPADGGGLDVYLSNGDGTFALSTKVTGVNGAPGAVIADPLVATDLNRDGHADVVVGGGGWATVALGHGDGTFAPATGYSGGAFTGSPIYFPDHVFVRDFTGDGVRDILLTSPGFARVALLHGNGDGTFGGLTTQYPSPTTVGAPAVGDFTGDGRPDLVFVPNKFGDATILANAGDGTFLEWRTPVVGPSQSGDVAVVTDLDGDGRDDIAFSTGSSYTLLGTGEVPLAATFVLGDGAARTASRVVSIDSRALNVTEMRFCDDKSDWTDWRIYADHSTCLLSDVDGTRTLTAQYRNAAGDVIELTHSIVLDTTGPGITWGHSEVWNKDYTEIWIRTSDAGSGTSSGLARIEYRLDGGQWQTAAKRNSLDYYYYGYMGDGLHVFVFRCYDALGNMSGPITSTIRVDSSAPVTIAHGADSGWHHEDTSVTFTAVDSGVGVARTEYSLDGGATWAMGTAVTVFAHPDPGVPSQVGGEGEHVIKYRSVDSFGHVEIAKSCVVRMTSDVTPPVVTQTGADGAWHNKPVKVTFGATDLETTVAGYEYSTNGGPIWTPGASVTFVRSGVTTLYYRATDAHGNVSKPGTCTVRIDDNSPTPAGAARVGVRRGRMTRLPYQVSDVAGQSPTQVKLRLVDRRGRTVRTRTMSSVTLNAGLVWKFRCRLAKGRYTMTITASDAAGNEGTRVARDWLTVK